MAAGALVPHKLPNGQVVMVPDYLAPKGPGALAMPEAPKPQGPDLRLASNGPAPILSQLSPDFAKVQQFSQSKPDVPSPLGQAVVAPPEDAEQRRKRVDSERATAAAREAAGKADPKKLKPVPKADPRAESSVISSTASDLYKPKGGTGPAKVNPENLNLVAAEVKQERQPGMRLLPEQEWRLGLSERPAELYEVDPEASQKKGVSTWGDDETEAPVMREKLTPLEKGANKAGEFAKAEYERQLAERQEMGIAQRQMLADQSRLVDEELSTIAQRRERIAKLQETADQRMRAAESTEPRTKSEIWESKSGPAQVMAFLAAAIGGYAQGLGRNGGKNPGWDMINNFLDAEVEGERYKAEQRKKLGLEARNDVERAMAQYGDLEMAALESKNRKLANVMATTQQMLADRGVDALAKQRGEQVYAAAQEQYLANKQQLFDAITGKVTKEEATLKPYGQVVQAATPKATGSGGGSSGGMGGITGDKLRGLSAEMRSLAVKLPNGRFKFARSKDEKKELQDKMVNVGAMIARLRELQSLRADKANTIKWGDKRGRLAAIGADLIRLGKSKDAMGTLDQGLLDFSVRQFGTPEEFNVVDNETDGKIAQQIAMLESEARKVSEYYLDDGAFELTEGGVTPDEVKD